MDEKEKAKAYDEALERAKKLQENSNGMILNKWLIGVFPELAESEDEKIRKAIIEFFELQDDNTTYSFVPKKDVIAWLEKQGEHKPTDKNEPKFHEGDWVIDKQGLTHKISRVMENVSTHTFGYDIVGGGYFNDNTEGVRLWTVEDAKDGDVLYFSDDTIVIFKDLYNSTTFHSYCHIEDNTFGFATYEMGDWWECEGFYPATKEQRDLLFQKMKEAGYEWDAEKKELKKIEQKPDWSEEDEENLQNCCGAIAAADYYTFEDKQEMEAWLKSLKERLKGG